jgi:hypothetical protein
MRKVENVVFVLMAVLLVSSVLPGFAAAQQGKVI